MKKWKKSLAGLLSAAMLLGLLAACDSGEKPSGASGAPDATPTPAAADGEYPITPEELGSGEAKWSEEKTADGWMKVTNQGGATLGYSPDSGVKLIQVDGLAFKDLNRNGKLDLYEDWRQEDNARAADLASQMSTDEITGLMIHPMHSNIEADASDMTELLDCGLRFVLSGATAYPVDVQAKWNNAMQTYVEGVGHGIPVSISTNPRTTPAWPDNLGLAATFDPDVVFEAAKGMSKGYRAIGITTLLGPQIDLASEPRWSRIGGTFGEDPALSRDMTAASVAGHQSTYDENGTDIGWGMDSVNAMIKHWPGDGNGESGRESHDDYGQFAVYPGGQFMTSLIPFVDGGLNSGSLTGQASSVMTSYSIAWSDNEAYGEPVGTAYSEYKIDLLHAYGFDGVICTDWNITIDADWGRSRPWGVKDLTPEERYYKAIVSGVDQFGGVEKPDTIREAYKIAVKNMGEDAAAKRFQDSAYRLMMMSFQTGIFENAYVDVGYATKTVGGEEMSEAGYEAKLKSIVMLKNSDGTIQAEKTAADEKPTVYIPYLFAEGYTNVVRTVSNTAALPVDLSTARKYFNVVTDSLSDTLTGPLDKDGNPTPAYEDIIRATPDELENCDFALVFVNSPQNIVDGTLSGGYDAETKKYIPISLQYGEYTADSETVRLESISGEMIEEEIASPYGVQRVKVKENRSYYGQHGNIANSTDLDAISYAVDHMPQSAKVIVAIDASNPMVVSEFEHKVDAILMGFKMDKQAVMDIVTGQYEPSALLPFQMPASMETVEAQLEDVPRDMECYVDANGNTYDFGFGLNWSGVIQDERTAKYCVPPLTEPAAQPIQ